MIKDVWPATIETLLCKTRPFLLRVRYVTLDSVCVCVFVCVHVHVYVYVCFPFAIEKHKPDAPDVTPGDVQSDGLGDGLPASPNRAKDV